MGMKMAVVICFCTLIAVIDVKTYRIPDLLLVCFAAVMAILYRDDPLIMLRLFSSLTALLIFGAVFITTGGMGLGDVKYAVVLGYILNLDRLVPAFLISALLALMVYTAGMLLFRWKKIVRIPFAPFLSCGAIAAIVCGLTLSGLLP